MLSTVFSQRGKLGSAVDWTERILSDRRVMIGFTVLPVLVLFGFVTVIPVGWTVFAGFHQINAFSPE